MNKNDSFGLLNEYLIKIYKIYKMTFINFESSSFLPSLFLYKKLSEQSDFIDYSNDDNNSYLFYIEKESRLSFILNEGRDCDISSRLNTVLHEIEELHLEMNNIFNDVIRYLPRIDISKLRAILYELNSLNFNEMYEWLSPVEVASEIYEFIARENSKFADDFITPASVCNLISSVALCYERNPINIIDMSCGSCGLLLNVSEQAFVINEICAQDINESAINLAKTRVLISYGSFNKFSFNTGDSLNELKFSSDSFDLVISVPPFNARWDPGKMASIIYEDLRFSSQSADLAFLWRGFKTLSDDGVMVIALTHGVLSRKGRDKEIRKALVEKYNCIEAIVSMPANIFYGTNISACLIVVKKNRKLGDPILFINASNSFEKDRYRNR